MRILDRSTQRRLDTYNLHDIVEACNENDTPVLLWDHANRMVPDAAAIINTLELSDREAAVYHRIGGDWELIVLGNPHQFRYILAILSTS